MQSKTTLDSILIINRQSMIRQGWASMLEARAGDVIAQTTDHHTAIRTPPEKSPQVIIIDVDGVTPNEVPALKELRKTFPNARLIPVASRLTLTKKNQLIFAGAAACLSKGASLDEMCQAIENRIINGGGCLDDEPAVNPSLTKREMEVARFIAKGLRNGEIAEILNISEKTVGVYRNKILRQCKVKNTPALVNLLTSEENTFLPL